MLILAGLLAVMVIAAMRATEAFRGREARDRAVLGIGAATLAGIVWSLFVLNGWADLVVLLPAAAVGVGAVAAEVQARVPKRVAVPILVTWSVTCLLAALISSFTNREHVLDQQRTEVAGMFAAVPSDATVMSVGGPQPLVLTHRTNPIRHQMFLTGLNEYVDDTWPGGLEGLADGIREEEPTFITVDHRGGTRGSRPPSRRSTSTWGPPRVTSPGTSTARSAPRPSKRSGRSRRVRFCRFLQSPRCGV